VQAEKTPIDGNLAIELEVLSSNRAGITFRYQRMLHVKPSGIGSVPTLYRWSASNSLT